MSSWGTVAEMSSTHANRCVILPCPSSPRLPSLTLLHALCRWILSRGWMTLFRICVAKVDDKGHPWLTPSVIEIIFQLFVFHL